MGPKKFTFLVAVFFASVTYVTKCGARDTEISVDAAHRRELATSSPVGLCFEKISQNNYIYMAGHPANAKYAIFALQTGVLHLMKLPSPGSRRTLSFTQVFLDISERVWSGGERGLLSFAFHPEFTKNGRIFLSYTCNSDLFPDCKSTCSCNKNTGCVLGERDTTCNTTTVIAEYRVPSPKHALSKVTKVEVRKIMAFGRPYGNHVGGQIFFGKDGYLYITSGDGGGGGDPFKFAQNGLAPLGKIFRVDVNNIAKGKTYNLPRTNPFINKAGILPEIYALGLRNPWRCSSDYVTGRIFCGDVGQGLLEEVDDIYSGYNYGWNRLEGTVVYNATTAVKFGKLASPLFQYAHFGLNIKGAPVGGVCVIGGYVYRAKRNACLMGKYIYSDLVGTQFIGTVYPPKGVKPTTIQVPFLCSPKSSLPCSTNLTLMGGIWSWGVDTNYESYMLATSGVYRLANLATCGLAC